MPDKDISRKAVEQTSRTLGKLQLSFMKRIPYGPRNEVMSPMEERRKIQDMDASVKLQKMQEMGPEAWDAYMKELYDGKLG